MTTHDRRSETRSMCAEIVRVRIQNGGDVQEMVATLEDISPSGACVQLDASTAEGAAIEIVCAKCRLKGTVRYCRFAEIGYDVGVAFERRGSWNPRQFTPKHLLQLPSTRPQ